MIKISKVIIFKSKKSDDEVLGVCPVFSEKTRCCNLLTLDAVMNCGFGCSYCSIQSFYHGDEIVFHEDFGEKLAKIKLDPDKIQFCHWYFADPNIWSNPLYCKSSSAVTRITINQ